MKKTERKTDQHGFVMLEVVLIILLLMMTASTMYGLAGAEYRRALARVHEDEAYYAAVSAVRMMAQAVVSEDEWENSAAGELIAGLKKMETEIVFETDFKDEMEMVSVPVTVWSVREHGELVLGAETNVGGNTQLVTMKLRRKTEKEKENDGEWIPISYEIGDGGNG